MRPLLALWCLAGLIGSAPLSAQQRPAPERPGTRAAIAVDATSSLPALSGNQLAASVAWLLGKWYGRYVIGRPGVDSAEGPPWRLRLAVAAGTRGVKLRSELIAADGSATTRSAWLPAGSLGALTATAAADGFWLWAQAQRFPHLAALAPAPARTALLPAQAVGRLGRQPPAAAAARVAAGASGGILMLLSDGPLALGSRFEITPDTMLWLTWREYAPPGAWRGIHPLGDGRVVLQPAAGPALLVDPYLEESVAADHRTEPGAAALLTVTPSGTQVLHRPGLLEVRQPAGTAGTAATLELPVGSIAATAVTGDGRGAVWAFDPRERRVRVFAPGTGNRAELRQLYAVTPLLPWEELSAVQTIALTGDGHLLIGSRRAIWKLDRRGLPLWSLDVLGTRPRQRLPQAFSVVPLTDAPAFLLLDRTTGMLHRFDEQPGPDSGAAETPLLLRPDDAPPAPGALPRALTSNALRAAEQAWQRHYPHAAHRLLAAARRHLSRWRAADPLARDADRHAAAIETLGEWVERGLYGEPLFALEVAPDTYHPALHSHYQEHPFRLSLHNRSGSAVQSVVELGVAGTTRSATLRSPTIAPGATTTLLVPLHAPAAHGTTDLAREVSLWLRAAPAEGAPAVLAHTPLSLEARRCVPKGATRAGAAHAAFLRWHAATADATLTTLAAMPLATHELVDALARLAEVNVAEANAAEAPCSLQPVVHTLASGSGTATDWALALAALLARRGDPALLLLSGEHPAMVLMRPGGPAGSFPAAGAALDEVARRQLDNAQSGAMLTAGAEPVWALLPVPGAAGSGSGPDWRNAGARRAATALQPGAGAWRLVSVADIRRPRAGEVTVGWAPVLPLGAGVSAWADATH